MPTVVPVMKSTATALCAGLAPHHQAAAERLVPAGGPVLAVGPAANWSGKQWRGQRFAELLRRLTAPRPSR